MLIVSKLLRITKIWILKTCDKILKKEKIVCLKFHKCQPRQCWRVIWKFCIVIKCIYINTKVSLVFRISLLYFYAIAALRMLQRLQCTNYRHTVQYNEYMISHCSQWLWLQFSCFFLLKLILLLLFCTVATVYIPHIP